ncbi:hypothetical protein MVEN_01160400 [Mycena venus]|uniref:DUF6535 domain-containing protein n=1 Tax=Mycena venus TaxID=2733690 RepID=A0A8H6Y543_9AGAR|nr:hypothetical protein MVEN_01160400 [Mycena venus]
MWYNLHRECCKITKNTSHCQFHQFSATAVRDECRRAAVVGTRGYRWVLVVRWAALHSSLTSTTMPDPERTSLSEKAPDTSEEAAASKLWAVYVLGAEKYDKSLVESWKSDMQGMLIFAGLFSASLTAFIIESYKTLMPDSGDSTVLLLSQISQQLAAASNGTTFEPSLPTHFSPTAASLICNALWFISLGLSLTCALVATLLEQWARDFLHRADMRSAPVIRARIFSYLYYGIKRFNMHTIVDLIPLLLHASLVFFFAGLVAFLIPINVLIVVVAVTLLLIVVVVYSILTFLPLWYLDCPYRTPLSTAFWRLSRTLMTVWHHRHEAVESEPTILHSTETMVEAMSRRAMEMSPGRAARDHRALVWTVKSLVDDAELEPFVEGIPDVLWGPEDRRYTYEDHIQKLMRNPELRLLSRIAGLLSSCDSGLLSAEAGLRRRNTCYKALWAIASIQTPPGFSTHFKPLNFSDLITYWNDTPDHTDTLHYSASAVALMKWSTLFCMKDHLAMLARDLTAAVERGHPPDFRPVRWYLQQHLSGNWDFLGMSLTMADNFLTYIYDTIPDNNNARSFAMVAEFTRAVDNFAARGAHRPFFNCFAQLALLESPPYRWVATQQIIAPNHSIPFSIFQDDLERALGDVVYSIRPHGWTEPTKKWNDTLIETLCPFWRPEDPTPIPHALIHYINERKLGNLEGLWIIVDRLWSAFPITLAHPPHRRSPNNGAEDARKNVMTALWRVACSLGNGPGCRPELYQRILKAVVGSSESAVAVSVVATIKTLAVDILEDLSNPCGHLVLPAETAIAIRSSNSLTSAFQQTLYDRKVEATIALLAEFLEGCSADFVPYKAMETIRFMGAFIPSPRAAVHPSHQLRLANGISHMSNRDNTHVELLEATISHCHIFDFVANAAAVAPTYNDIMVNDLAARHPGLSFIHAYPGTVATNLLKTSDTRIVRAANTFLTPLLSHFMYSVETSGEHQLYALLKAGPGAVRTNDSGDDIGLTKAYYGSPEAMARLWKHTEEATRV